MKTSSSIYVRRNVGVMALTHSSTFHMSCFFTQKLYKIQINSEEIQINSNKLE